ncbi:T9SS type A sorting domain-containing protein [Sungkyunkwania multivorans]|uniref:T9SS type A sorting domain-containing protein n=1 Tax=Sungkyunkwania multivorans TaxID=1173618 RepID=A0ABW3D0R1_9FLAO
MERSIITCHVFIITILFTGSMYAQTSADLSFQDVSINMRPNASQSASDDIPRIRIGFENEIGFHRQLLLAIVPGTTDGIDWGYDGALIENQTDDMYWLIEGQPHVIQAIGNISSLTHLSLGIRSGSSQMVTIMLDELENFDEDLPLFIFDHQSRSYVDITDGPYSFFVAQGEHTDRFSMIFPGSVLSLEDKQQKSDKFMLFFDSNGAQLVVKNDKSELVANITIYDLGGQRVWSGRYKQVQGQYEVPMFTATGVYMAVIETKEYVVSKKFVKN